MSLMKGPDPCTCTEGLKGLVSWMHTAPPHTQQHSNLQLRNTVLLSGSRLSVM
jgi:hypothetical protein